MNILLAQDGSEVSLRAATKLVEHLKWFAAPPHIHLLYVHPPVPIEFATQHLSRGALDAYYREEGEQALRAARDLLDANGIGYTPHIHVGSVAETIAKRAGELDCELICMGTHGRGTLGSALMGSVTAKVLHLTGLPVMVVK
jgi:nucleotide-binding universal stress UspA family protein